MRLLEIREINKKEIPNCVSVIRDSFLTVAQAFQLTRENAPRYVAFSISEKELKKQWKNALYAMFGCFTPEEQLIGFYALCDLKDGSCELNHLCVIPSQRHQGVGRMLLKDALKRAEASGFQEMRLSLIEENKELKDWYLSFGFQHTDVRRFEHFPFTCGYMMKPLQN